MFNLDLTYANYKEIRTTVTSSFPSNETHVPLQLKRQIQKSNYIHHTTELKCTMNFEIVVENPTTLLTFQNIRRVFINHVHWTLKCNSHDHFL